jgi:ketosteroid isomerase-like protein
LPTHTPFPKVVLEGKGKTPRTREEAELMDMQGIRAVLDRYKAASEKLDASAIQDIWPSLSRQQVQQMQKAFGAYASQSVRIKLDQVRIDGARATVRAQVSRTISPKIGREVTDDREVTIVLRKIGDSWFLEDFH